MKKIFTYLNDLFVAIMVVSFRPIKTRENLDYWRGRAENAIRQRDSIASENQRLTTAIIESAKLSGWKSNVRRIYSVSESVSDGREIYGCTLTPDGDVAGPDQIYFEATTRASAIAGALTQLNARRIAGPSTDGGDDTIQINNN